MTGDRGRVTGDRGKNGDERDEKGTRGRENLRNLLNLRAILLGVTHVGTLFRVSFMGRAIRSKSSCLRAFHYYPSRKYLNSIYSRFYLYKNTPVNQIVSLLPGPFENPLLPNRSSE